MAPQKSKVNMPGVASGKELVGIPTGNESPEERVLALLGGSVAENTYQVSVVQYIVLRIEIISVFDFCSFSCGTVPRSSSMSSKQLEELRNSKTDGRGCRGSK
jgi:hypothetical protein